MFRTLRYWFFVIVALNSLPLLGQEICDNGIDDDGDGLVDLNDTDDCSCSVTATASSLIPNPSFEVYDGEGPGCTTANPQGEPDFIGQADCLAGWVQSSDGTTDAWNNFTVDFSSQLFGWSFPLPFPDGERGAGIVYESGTLDAEGNPIFYKEYISTCFEGGRSLSPDTTYLLRFRVGVFERSYLDFGEEPGLDSILFDSPLPAELAIYGIKVCDALRFSGTDCPENTTDGFAWGQIGTAVVEGTAPGWLTTEITFTPSVEFFGFGIGGICVPVEGETGLWSYYYVLDDLQLYTLESLENILLGDVQIAGSECTGDLRLTAPAAPGATFQWYRDGEALPGQTSAIIDPYTLGEEGGLFRVRVTLDGECVASNSIPVRPRPDLPVLAADTFAICPATPTVGVEVSAPDLPGISYQWPAGETGTNAFFSESGSYLLRYFSSCGTEDIEFVIADYASANFTIEIDATPGCPAPTTVPVTINTAWNYETFAVSDITGFPLAEIGANETFTLYPPYPDSLLFTGTLPFCGTDQRTLTLAVETPLDFTATVTPLTCRPGSVVIASTETLPLIYSWTDPDGSIIPGADSLSVNIPGQYSLRLTNGENCPVETTFSFEQRLPVVEIATVSRGCGVVDLMATVSNGTAPYSYAWADGAGITVGANEPTLSATTAETFVLTVTDAQGCTYQSTATIAPEQITAIDLGDDLQILPGDTVSLGDDLTFPSSYRYSWSPAEGLSCTDCPRPIAAPTRTTSYQLVVTSTEGSCVLTDNILIAVDEGYRAYFPTAFSPNRDGVNDVFAAFPGRGVDDVVELNVYDRWGGLVFTGDNEWDGTSKGLTVVAGVYAYRATLLLAGRRTVERSGLVALVR